MVRADFLQLSVNDKITLNNRSSSASNEEDTRHDLWAGIGIGGKGWHLAAYGDYVNDVALALSLFF